MGRIFCLVAVLTDHVGLGNAKNRNALHPVSDFYYYPYMQQ